MQLVNNFIPKSAEKLLPVRVARVFIEKTAEIVK